MREYLKRSITYKAYLNLVDGLLEQNETTGTNQSEAMVGYGRLNRHRMSRLEKTLEIDDENRSLVASAKRGQVWLILTEGWCGDAAQNLPVVEKLAAENGRIETRYLLRDENLELMDQYLTNGARSIPKLIALDAETLEVIWTWGARPKIAQDLYQEMKTDGVEKADILEVMQRWYNEDKGRSTASEIAGLVVANEKTPSVAVAA